ncbi:MAG: hypothetical protein KJ831_10180 [Candidatus Eisenbacteria bacterium]|nr:hypothetical protein [Candidatus Eisenbacteria bacterium]
MKILSPHRNLTCCASLRRVLLLLSLVFLAPLPANPQTSESEPWYITGERLEGIFGGRSRMDHIEIQHGVFRATALEGIWDPGREEVFLQGEVHIADTSRVMTSDSAMYNRRTGILTMIGNVKGRGPEGRMGGESLLYRRQEGWGRLTAGAWLEDENQRVEADTVVYEDAVKRSQAFGHVKVIDLADSTRAMGDVGLFDRTRNNLLLLARAPQRPYLVRAAGEEEPPFIVEADTLQMDQGQGRAEAIGNVVVQQGRMGARGGKARFFKDQNRMELFGAPKAWDPDGSVAGDTLRLVLGSEGPERLLVLGHARAEYLPKDRPGEETFALGDTLVTHFQDDRIRRMDVRSGAQSLYIPALKERGQDVGRNWSQAAEIVVLFQDGKAHRVEMRGDAKGIYTFPRKKGARDSLSAEGAVDSTAAAPPDSLRPLSRRGRPRVADDPHPLIEARRSLLASGDLREPDSLAALGAFDPKDQVVYEGQHIVFLVSEDMVIMENESIVQYQGMTLEADSVQFNSLRETIVATGKPKLKDNNSVVDGDRMSYRLDTRKGLIHGGVTEFENGIYRGDEIKRVEDNTLYVKDAAYTTCDSDTPHFSFWSSSAKIRTKDKALARPVILKIGRIPIMALPYWIFPLRSGRRSGILMPDVEFGFDRDRGRFVRNIGYYWAVNDYMDLLTWGDYYERGPRYIFNSRYRYKMRYLLSGSFFGSFSKEQYSDKSETIRWDFQADHSQTLRDNLTLKFRADFVSDAQYRGDRDFGAGTDERLNRTLKSNLDLRQRWNWGSLALTMDRTEYLDETSSAGVKVKWTAPSIDFSPTSFTLGRASTPTDDAGWRNLLASTYLRTGFSFRSVSTDYFHMPTESHSASRATFGLSDARRLGNILNISPSINATTAWFDEDLLGQKNQVGAVWSGGLSTSSTIYGTFFPRIGPLAGIRHVIEPTASYRYQPDFPDLQYPDSNGVQRNRFPSVGGISIGGSKVSQVSFGLTQKLNLKWGSGESERKIDNLILWTTSTGYNFLEDETPWSSLENTIRLIPSRIFESRWSHSYDMKRDKRTRLSVQNYLRLSGAGLGDEASPEYGDFGDPEDMGRSDPGENPSTGSRGGGWSLNLTHTLSQGETRSSRRSDLNLSSSLNVTPNWRLSYSVYYDVENEEVKSQGFTLYRDLHCWEARLEKRISGRTSQYYFRVNIKQLPDVKYERRQSSY